MNLFFGTASGSASAALVKPFVDHIVQTYGEPEVLSLGGLGLGYLSRDGNILGLASEGGAHLMLCGFLHRPLPGEASDGPSPLDDPNRAARYLLNRYLDEGDDFLEGVFGRFSVAVVDSRAHKVILGVDPYGHCKLFYHHADGHLRFATQLLTLGRGLDADLQLDRSLEDFFLVHGFRPWQRTPFEGIRYLPPRTRLVWQDGELSQHSIESPSPWAANLEPLEAGDSITEPEMIDLLYNTFMGALEDQLSSDPRAAVLLGGFDSGLVAAGLHRLGKEVETFSYTYHDARYNQPHTDTLARHLRIQHHNVVIDEEIIGDGLSRYPELFHFPTNWPNYVIQTLHVAEKIRERGLSYCYTGDGCDGIFMGYPLTFQRSKLVQLLGRFPSVVHRILLGSLTWPFLDRRLGRPYTVFLSLLRGASRPHPARSLVTLQVFDPMALDSLRSGDRPPQEADLEDILQRLAEPHREEAPEQLAYKGKNMVSPGNTKMTACADHHGLVVTSPYMHAGMGQFAAKMPTKFLRPQGQDTNIGKYILSRMAEEKGLLPPEIIYQTKVGATDAPLETWYPGVLQPLMRDLLADLPFKANPAYVDSFFRTKAAEKAYGKLLGRQTNNVTYLQHGISLLASYAGYSRACGSKTKE